MEISIDDLTDPRIADFLEAQLKDMKAVSPLASKRVLDIEQLKQPYITFWSVWQEDELVGCGAIKELNKKHGEIKSMRTDISKRGEGIGTCLLKHILAEAKHRGYERVSLETGSMPFSSQLASSIADAALIIVDRLLTTSLTPIVFLWS